MRLTLRGRVLGLVFVANALVFGIGGYLVLRDQIAKYRSLETDLTENLVSTIRSTVRPEGLNVPRILGWSSWFFFEDAIVVGRELEVSSTGRILPAGVDLNPVGIDGRAVEFDRQSVLVAIERSIRTGAKIDNVYGGRVAPIAGPRGEAWGGIWVRARERVDEDAFFASILRWFVLSTLVLTLGTFFALRRLVLDPVAEIGRGAERVRSGDLSARLPEPKRRDEIADVVRLFNDMARTVQGLNERLADEVKRATDKARRAEAAAMTQRRLAAMGELAAGIAHEINNPLGGLLNAVTTLGRDDLSDEKRDRYLRLLSTGLTRIGETVNRLRRFTPRQATHEPVDLTDVICDAVDLVRHRAERMRVEVNLHGLDDGHIVVSGARNEIGQAILNLLANSLDALEEVLSVSDAAAGTGPRDASRKPRIDVTAEVGEDSGVSISVRDNGPGVTEEELTRVQDLFYTTKEVGKGTGLGLSLVHNTLQQHGGTMHVSSEAGFSFQVDLWFPADGPGPTDASDARQDRGGENR
jgi:signal transduction histidine kinase